MATINVVWQSNGDCMKKNEIKSISRELFGHRIKCNILGFNFHLYRDVNYFTLNPDDICSHFCDIGVNGPFGPRVSYKKWTYKIKKVCPLQFYFRHVLLGEIYSFFRLKKHQYLGFVYNIKCTINPKNVLKLSNIKYNEYTAGGTLLLQAMFQILDDYINSHPEAYVDFDALPNTKREWKEVCHLYEWWKLYPSLQKTYEKMLDDLYEQYRSNTISSSEWIDKYTELENEFNRNITKHMLRLVKIRHALSF